MFQYLIGYLQNFTKFLEKDKINIILETLDKDFANINDIKIQFNITINICDFYFFIIKDYETMKKYINDIFILLNKNLDCHENLELLIILINKILIYINKENITFFIEIINNSIKLLKESKLINDEKGKEEFKEIYSYYKRTLEYIEKNKVKKNNPAYDLINI